MSPALLAAVLLLASACDDRRASTDAAPWKPAQPAAAPPAAAPPPATAPAAWTSEQQTCVDRWLAERKLDPYGAAQGTMYAGGTPLFDEATGQSLSRQSYLGRHKKDALTACGLTP